MPGAPRSGARCAAPHRGSSDGARVHNSVGPGHSLGAVQKGLRDLELVGLITTETIGRAGVHRINEEHDAISPLRALASPLDMLTRVAEEEAPAAESVIVFGLVPRGEAHAYSDIDLAVVAPEDWDGRADLAERAHARLGNKCDVLHVTTDQSSRDAADR